MKRYKILTKEVSKLFVYKKKFDHFEMQIIQQVAFTPDFIKDIYMSKRQIASLAMKRMSEF